MQKSSLISLLLVLVLTACQAGATETELAPPTKPAGATEQIASYPTPEPLGVTEQSASYPTLEPSGATEQSASYPTPEPSGATEQSASYPTPEPFPFPSSESGLITIHGTLVAKNPFAMAPDPDDPVFLVPLPGDSESISTIPPFTIGEVPRATVDIRNGEFVFANIQPGQYAIVVLLTTGTQIPAKFLDGGNLAIIKLSESDFDQVVEVGYVGVP